MTQQSPSNPGPSDIILPDQIGVFNINVAIKGVPHSLTLETNRKNLIYVYSALNGASQGEKTNLDNFSFPGRLTFNLSLEDRSKVSVGDLQEVAQRIEALVLPTVGGAMCTITPAGYKVFLDLTPSACKGFYDVRATFLVNADGWAGLHKTLEAMIWPEALSVPVNAEASAQDTQTPWPFAHSPKYYGDIALPD